MSEAAPSYTIQDGLHCAEFIGRDQHDHLRLQRL